MKMGADRGDFMACLMLIQLWFPSDALLITYIAARSLGVTSERKVRDLLESFTQSGGCLQSSYCFRSCKWTEQKVLG